MNESIWIVWYFRNSTVLYHSTYFFPPNLTRISLPVFHGFPVRALWSFPVWYISDPYKTEPWPVSKFRVGSLSGEQITILITVLIIALLIHLFRLASCMLFECYLPVNQFYVQRWGDKINFLRFSKLYQGFLYIYMGFLHIYISMYIKYRPLRGIEGPTDVKLTFHCYSVITNITEIVRD